jgi:hypothetical protein
VSVFTQLLADFLLSLHRMGCLMAGPMMCFQACVFLLRHRCIKHDPRSFFEFPQVLGVNPVACAINI